MTLRTGTSRTGAIHRYYTCSTCARQGQSACKGRSVRMDRLDILVIDHIADHLLQPRRLGAMLVALAGRRALKTEAVESRVTALEKEAHEANERLRRLYKLVEDGLDCIDGVLGDRILNLKEHEARARAALERARSATRPATEVSPLMIERFGQTMRQNLTSGAVQFRKAYLRAIIDRVEVDDTVIRIVGRKDVLEQAVLAGGPPPGVRSFVRKWRSLGEAKHHRKTPMNSTTNGFAAALNATTLSYHLSRDGRHSGNELVPCSAVYVRNFAALSCTKEGDVIERRSWLALIASLVSADWGRYTGLVPPQTQLFARILGCVLQHF
jgi:hypothetical protein